MLLPNVSSRVLYPILSRRVDFFFVQFNKNKFKLLSECWMKPFKELGQSGPGNHRPRIEYRKRIGYRILCLKLINISLGIDDHLILILFSFLQFDYDNNLTITV